MTEFMKAGVRGISVIVASGDFGAREFYPNITFPDYAPDYPASSMQLSFSIFSFFKFHYSNIKYSGPYVTSVGGTIFQAKHDHRSCFTVSNKTKICNENKQLNEPKQANTNINSQSNWTYICDVVEAAASGANGAIIASGGGFSNLFNRPSYQVFSLIQFLFFLLCILVIFLHFFSN